MHSENKPRHDDDDDDDDDDDEDEDEDEDLKRALREFFLT